MKIAIDISQVIYETGVSVYVSELVKHLLKIDKKNTYILFGGSLRRRHDLIRFADELESKNAFFKITSISPQLADLLGNKYRIGKVEAITGKVDIVHTSDWSEPKADALKVTTIHDFAPILYPNETHPNIVSVHKRKLELVKKESDKVIVPSIATKEDAVTFGINKEKIIVVPEAPRDIFTPKSEKEISNVKVKYGISGSYALAVGSVPRKNIKRIAEAFIRIKKEAEIDRLIVIGRSYGELINNNDILYLGHIPTADLPAIYSGAKVLVYTSLYEGFGLPVLEAYACGCPVVTSNTSSLVEIGKSSSVLVNPQKTDQISQGILECVKNSQKYKKSGFLKIKKYSWEKTARETLKVYSELNARG